MDTLAYFFETAEAAQAAAQPLARAGLIGREFEIDTDLERYGVAAALGGKPCVLRVHLDPGQSEALVREMLGGSGGRPVPLPPEDDRQRLSLEVERLRTEQLWRAMLGQYVPLSVAAATTYHQVHGASRAIVTRQAYDEALDLAAGALAKLLAIYTLGPRERRREIPVDFATQRFAFGASELRSADGRVTGQLFVRRTDLLFALGVVKRHGLPKAQGDEKP